MTEDTTIRLWRHLSCICAIPTFFCKKWKKVIINERRFRTPRPRFCLVLFSCEIALRWMSLGVTDEESALIVVMAWYRKPTRHYVNHGWPMSPFCNSWQSAITVTWRIDQSHDQRSCQYIHFLSCELNLPLVPLSQHNSRLRNGNVIIWRSFLKYVVILTRIDFQGRLATPSLLGHG